MTVLVRALNADEARMLTAARRLRSSMHRIWHTHSSPFDRLPPRAWLLSPSTAAGDSTWIRQLWRTGGRVWVVECWCTRHTRQPAER